jgi:hypothetical protein
MGDELIQKRGECIGVSKRGPSGDYSWVLIKTHIPEFYYD